MAPNSSGASVLAAIFTWHTLPEKSQSLPRPPDRRQLGEAKPRFPEIRGLGPTAAEGGQIVLEKRDKGSFDFLRMDVQIANLNGLNAMPVRKRLQTRIPVIASTAHALSGSKWPVSRPRMDGDGARPIRGKDLFAMFEEFLRNDDEFSVIPQRSRPGAPTSPGSGPLKAPGRII